MFLLVIAVVVITVVITVVVVVVYEGGGAVPHHVVGPRLVVVIPLHVSVKHFCKVLINLLKTFKTHSRKPQLD